MRSVRFLKRDAIASRTLSGATPGDPNPKTVRQPFHQRDANLYSIFLKLNHYNRLTARCEAVECGESDATVKLYKE